MSGKTLEGRKALVTGGARGIGAAIAQALAHSGASVMIGDILEDAGRASACAIAAPIPLAPPVTRAFRPSRVFPLITSSSVAC